MYSQLPKGRRPKGIHIRQKPKCSVLQLICNTSHPYQADSLKCRKSITQANTSATTGYIIYTCLKILIIGQQLVHSGYDERTNPRDIMENFGYVSLMF